MSKRVYAPGRRYQSFHTLVTDLRKGAYVMMSFDLAASVRTMHPEFVLSMTLHTADGFFRGRYGIRRAVRKESACDTLRKPRSR